MNIAFLPPVSQWPASARLLLAANTLPLLMALFGGWNTGELLVLYWLETGIIGFFNVIKMALAGGEGGGPLARGFSKFFSCVFFTVHFGGFMAGHGVFIFGLLLGLFKMNGGFYSIPGLLLGLKWAALALFVSHAYSFYANYLGKERATATIDTLMKQPYARIVVMHLTIVLGFGLVQAAGSTAALAALFAALKTAVDLKWHLRERSGFLATVTVERTS